MGGRSVWRESLGVWTARWRGFVILRIRLGVHTRRLPSHLVDEILGLEFVGLVVVCQGFSTAFGKTITGLIPCISGSGFGGGVELVFCATTTSHSPRRFSTIIVNRPKRSLRGVRSRLRSFSIFQLQ